MDQFPNAQNVQGIKIGAILKYQKQRHCRFLVVVWQYFSTKYLHKKVNIATVRLGMSSHAA